MTGDRAAPPAAAGTPAPRLGAPSVEAGAVKSLAAAARRLRDNPPPGFPGRAGRPRRHPRPEPPTSASTAPQNRRDSGAAGTVADAQRLALVVMSGAVSDPASTGSVGRTGQTQPATMIAAVLALTVSPSLSLHFAPFEFSRLPSLMNSRRRALTLISGRPGLATPEGRP